MSCVMVRIGILGRKGFIEEFSVVALKIFQIQALTSGGILLPLIRLRSSKTHPANAPH